LKSQGFPLFEPFPSNIHNFQDRIGGGRGKIGPLKHLLFWKLGYINSGSKLLVSKLPTLFVKGSHLTLYFYQGFTNRGVQPYLRGYTLFLGFSTQRFQLNRPFFLTPFLNFWGVTPPFWAALFEWPPSPGITGTTRWSRLHSPARSKP